MCDAARAVWLFVAVPFLTVVSACPVSAQKGPPDKGDQIETLNRQIEALQRTLDGLEGSRSAANPKVGVISSTPARRERIAQPDSQLRIYDLSDLFTVSPPYPAVIGTDVGREESLLFPHVNGHTVGATSGGGLGGGGGGFGGSYFRVSPEANRTGLASVNAQDVAADSKSSVEDLIEVITGTIAPDRWENSGGEYSARRLGTSLVIHADTQRHEQIEGLLEQLRRRWGTLRTVSLDCWWVWLTGEELRELLPGNGQRDVPGSRLKAYGLVDDEAFQNWLAEAEEMTPGKGVHCHLSLTGYNGQTISGTEGFEESIVTNLEPVVSNSDEGRPLTQIAYRPQYSTLKEGVAVQLTPLVNTSGRFVMLDVRSRVVLKSSVRQPEAHAANAPAGSAREVADAVAKPRVHAQRLSTTLRIPVGQTMLIGGMKCGPEAGNLYLFVRTAVQELRDDVSSATKADADLAPPPVRSEDLPEQVDPSGE